MLSVHSSVKELEWDGESNFWFLDTGKQLACQLPGIKPQTHSPTEGTSGARRIASLEKDFDSGSLSKSVGPWADRAW